MNYWMTCCLISIGDASTTKGGRGTIYKGV